MKNILFIAFTFLFISVNAQTSIFNELLQKHVSKQGNVDYKGLKANETKLDSYLTYLASTSPDKSWSTNKQKAFWINAYNAYTLKLILNNYPLKSITDIKEKGNIAWKIPFVKVGGNTHTLDHLEHKILRKDLFDPRVHVGVNCASGSCPKLHNKAFTEENINVELDKLMVAFVNDSSKNKLNKKSTVHLSEIFNWFKEDFTKNGSVIDFINKYATEKVNKDAKIHYLPYDWNLNGK
ncbi:DUF547 domain-containing protein [Tenacibaculum aquimarinum]|uniref:DUF547 domain-containing protein n=1 Tax=Tenacibaculum aquimarinum TaxID=2910675 RepID=UPI001F0A6103|nr:DUF547 domain-containing protein [Tenacibaculum aquimarinum]MCH3885889.1 DUF547 domain-containing protein [Tenacibaculum aquimarinum]